MTKECELIDGQISCVRSSNLTFFFRTKKGYLFRFSRVLTRSSCYNRTLLVQSPPRGHRWMAPPGRSTETRITHIISCNAKIDVGLSWGNLGFWALFDNDIIFIALEQTSFCLSSFMCIPTMRNIDSVIQIQFSNLNTLLIPIHQNLKWNDVLFIDF